MRIRIQGGWGKNDDEESEKEVSDSSEDSISDEDEDNDDDRDSSGQYKVDMFPATSAKAAQGKGKVTAMKRRGGLTRSAVRAATRFNAQERIPDEDFVETTISSSRIGESDVDAAKVKATSKSAKTSRAKKSQLYEKSELSQDQRNTMISSEHGHLPSVNMKTQRSGTSRLVLNDMKSNDHENEGSKTTVVNSSLGTGGLCQQGSHFEGDGDEEEFPDANELLGYTMPYRASKCHYVTDHKHRNVEETAADISKLASQFNCIVIEEE
jgi:hypothetical protein